ncbi:SEL1-like repeat protein [Candidatus Thiosymbion oneisti]|nr:SEL1-like repeat protein [Candidatus Thiosymbion oneisti]
MKQAQGLIWLVRVWVAVAVVMLLAACTLIEKIAETSGPELQFSLGRNYEEGTPQVRDYERAAYWYRKAAE